jgi:elongation factor 1 alpha-like protein
MFDRTRQPQMSAFFNEENDIAEEDESSTGSSKQDHSIRNFDKYQQPGLSDVDEVRLRSCLEEIRNVIGDSIPEHILIDTVLKNEFNFNKALDAVLSSAASATEKSAGEFSTVFYLNHTVEKGISTYKSRCPRKC